MKIIFSLLFVLPLNICFAQTQNNEIGEAEINAMKGTWVVDLRPTPDSENYFKEFVIEIIDGESFSGIFYDTNFENGQLNTDWDRIYFAFTTNDYSNTYFHSGYFSGIEVFGISYSPERKFTLPWIGKKKTD